MKLDEIDDDLRERARNVRLLLMDCDGVLTDGRLYFSETGEAMKVFHVRDGQGLSTWHKRGHKSGIITGRGSAGILRRRTEELNIEYLFTNSIDKRVDFAEILRLSGLSAEQTAYIGDDVGDIELLKLVGLPATVADCATDVLPWVRYKTTATGGSGAVRELIDFIISLQPQ